MQNLRFFYISRIFSTLIVLSLVSCAGTLSSSPENTARRNKAPLRFDAGKMERLIHERINRERRINGLSPLAWNSELARIAREHSRDMAVRKYFSHFSPEGRDFSYRYKKAGYSCGILEGKRMYQGAENLFQNNLYDRVTYSGNTVIKDWNSPEKIAESTVRGWMNSSGHRKNILTPVWKSEGIGVFIAPDDKVYITQNFC